MGNDDLRRLLGEVHERLRNTSSVDDEARKLLTTVMRDIEKALARREAEAESTGERLESIAVQFEADHPAISETLRRLVDALGKAGI